MPFFIRGRGKPVPLKKKLLKGHQGRNATKAVNGLPVSKKRKVQDEEEITSDEEEFFSKYRNKEERYYKPVEEETAQEKKVRLAKQYLEELKKQQDEEAEDEEDIQRAIGLKLKEDVLEAAGRLHRTVADTLEVPYDDSIKLIRCKHHKLSLTCLAVSSDEKYIFTASKDSSIVKWSIEGERLGVIHGIKKSESDVRKGHSTHIFGLAVSTDNKFLASGDADGIIFIWAPDSLCFLRKFKKHRGAVSGLSFRKGSHLLFSASHDRMVMTWDLDVMSFTESLGGHQDAITSIDALTKESCITSGGRDETVIVYVIPEEKQLRFISSQVSIDGVKLVNEKTFVTYGQNGSLALWTTLKKRPHFTVSVAHGRNPENGEPYWLTAVASYVNTDVVASGSLDGSIKFWKIDHRKKILSALFSLPVPGVVNSMEFTHSGSKLIAAVGQEHKLGRWFTKKDVKNALVIIPLRTKS